MFVITCIITSMARNSLLCADVPLRNYSLTHSLLLLHGVTHLCSTDCLLICEAQLQSRNLVMMCGHGLKAVALPWKPANRVVGLHGVGRETLCGVILLLNLKPVVATCFCDPGPT